MKQIVYILTFLGLMSCNEINRQWSIDKCLDQGGYWDYTKNICNKTSENALISKSDRLINSYKQAITTHNEEHILEFILEFPNSFQEMQDLFGYDDEEGPAPLYDHELGGQIIKYFGSLNPKNKKQYYDKYININVSGVWEADHISNAFGIHKRILNDTENICPILTQRTDTELKSAFRFIFDGPHPDNQTNQQLNNEIQQSLSNKFERIKKLVNDAYLEAKNQEHNH